MEELINNVIKWAEDKNLLEEGNAPKQMLKLTEEVGETAGALLKGNKEGLIDGIGDCFVVLIILSKQLGLTPVQCLQAAWDEIKNRKGKTINGTFIKN